MEDPTSGTTHDLLLALAGRVDDDLLRWARELVALGEDARAVEMLTASLVASRAVLPPAVRSALVAAAHAARTDLGPAAALPPPHAETGTEHRFAAPRGSDPVAGALLEFPARPLIGCSVLLARRLTPAGTAPGPLPHPVVLVRVHDRTRRAEVLAYQLGAALERAGAPASVEVLPADGAVPAYHAAALDAAVQLREDVADDGPWRPSPQAESAVPAPPPAPPVERHALAPPVDRPPRRFAPEPHPLAPEPPSPAPRHPGDGAPRADDHATAENSAAATARLQPAGGSPAPAGSESATARLTPEPGHRPDDADEYEDDEQDDEDGFEDGDSYAGEDHVDRADEEEEDDEEAPAAHAEESFPEPPSPHPLAAPRPLPVRDDSRPARPTPLSARSNRPRPTVTPISRPAQNPIPLVRRTGPDPIPRPLPVADQRPPLRRVEDDRDELEPGVDQRPEEPREAQPPRQDTPAFESLSDPLNGPLHRPLLAPLLDPTRPEDDPLGPGAPRPADRRPEPAAAPQDDEWSQEWLSGTWAMAPSAFDERPEPEPVEDVDPGRPAPRPVPRHRFADEPAPTGSGTEREQPEDTGDEPSGRDGGDREEFGLRPDSISRLSDADRQLLARLQAELLEGRRQRIGRITNGAPTNGSHRGSPSD
ncbi:hypothetical protein [Pseudonocardia adelaidensis]|uniref:Basic proline-rich protein n=1 Tax=Pseudonocardia adelaidensis TaxID=648754 RepID=A0ABP9NK96_9PSEU